MMVNFSVILFASIYLTLQDRKWNTFPIYVSETRWGATVHLNPLMLRFNPRLKQRENLKITFEALEIENSSSCTKYIATSVHVWKTTKKKDNQNHVCILLHREALSVIRCVLLQVYSYWYLLQSAEKRSTLSSNGDHFMYTCDTSCGAKSLIMPLVWIKPLYQDSLKCGGGGITKAYWGSVSWNPSTASLHQAKNYADTREVNIKYLKTWQTISPSEWF